MTRRIGPVCSGYPFIPDRHSKSLFQRNLKSDTTLDAYGYVTDNHVQDILVHDYNTDNFVALKIEVLPSQRQGKRTVIYKVRVIINNKKQLHSDSPAPAWLGK